ncbi:MAG: GGDEF domain-containing protein [candidate division WOR-3 bacterium]
MGKIGIRIVASFVVVLLSAATFKLFERLYDTRSIGCGDCIFVSSFQSGDSTISVPFFSESPGTHIFRFNLRRVQCNRPSIFIPFIDGNYLAVYLNGHLIGTSGNLLGLASLRWNKPELFLMEKDLQRDSNEVKLVVKTENTVGVFYPIFVGDLRYAKTRYILLGFLNQVLNQFYISVFVVLGIFMILLPFMIGLRKHRAVVGISLILFALYLVDYLYIPYLPLPYAFYKKIVVSSLYLSMSLYALGFIYEFGYKGALRNAGYVLVIINAVLSLLLLATKNDSVIVRRTYLKLDVTVFLSMAFILLLFFKRALVPPETKSSDFLTTLSFYAVLFLLLYVFRDVYVLITNSPVPLLTQFVLPVFLLINVSYIVNDFTTLYRRLVLEKRRAEFLEMESMRDPLTGALNRRFLWKIREIVPELYTVCLIDIDGFKEFNDQFGHLLGDCVLRKMVSKMTSSLRKDDHIIRYGGDEFVILLYKTSGRDAEQVVGKIRDQFLSEKIVCEGKEFTLSFSYGIAAIGEGNSLEDLLKIADSRLYEAKNSKAKA